MQVTPSLYHHYVGKLKDEGTFIWRIKLEHLVKIVMNDIDSSSGNFKVHIYI